jgi:hypothetical protein
MYKTNFYLLAMALISTHSFADTSAPNWADPCINELPALNGGREANATNANHEPLYGFANGVETHNGILNASIVLETNAEAYFYIESSDIWQTFFKCDKITGSMTVYKEAHFLGCEDLPYDQLTSSSLLYKDCSAE